MGGSVLGPCDRCRYLLLYVYPVGPQSLAMTRAARAPVPKLLVPKMSTMLPLQVFAWLCPGSLGASAESG